MNVKKVLILLIAFSIGLSAKNYPVMQKQTIIIPVKKTIVFEFPFEIKDKIRKDVFYSKKKKSKLKITLDKLSELKTPTLKKSKGSKKVIPSGLSLPQFKQGKNVLEIFSRTKGEMAITIWGFKKYPIVINLKFVDDKENKETYFKFIDYNSQVKKNLNANTHEEAISRLVLNMFKSERTNHTEEDFCLKGMKYKNVSDTIITTHNLKLESSFECVGKRYAITKWEITNLNNFPISISQEEDYELVSRDLASYYKNTNVGVFSINFNIGEDEVFLKPHRTLEGSVVTNIEHKIWRKH